MATQMQQTTTIVNHNASDKPHKIQNSKTQQSEDRIPLEFILNVNDTFLHSLIGDIYAEKMKQIVEHKCFMMLMVIFFIIGVILLIYLSFGGALFTERPIIAKYYRITWMIIFCGVIYPWLIIKHLLFNRVAFKMCVQTFDYWIKVSYAFIWGIAQIFLVSIDQNILFVNIYIKFLMIILAMSYISSLDAVHSTKINKLVISVAGVLLNFWMSIYVQFVMKDELDYKITIQLTDGVSIISMQSLLASSTRILFIFMCKQSYKIWTNNGRAITISNSPKITWIGDEINDEATQKKPDKNVITKVNDTQCSTKTQIALEAYVADMKPEGDMQQETDTDSALELRIPVVPRLKTPQNSLSVDSNIDLSK